MGAEFVHLLSTTCNSTDNWALLYSQGLALKHRIPLVVCFCLVPKFLEATIRHYHFLLEGLKEVEKVREQCSRQFMVNYCMHMGKFQVVGGVWSKLPYTSSITPLLEKSWMLFLWPAGNSMQ